MYEIFEITFNDSAEIASKIPLELPRLSFSQAHKIARILMNARFMPENEGFLCVHYIINEIKDHE